MQLHRGIRVDQIPVRGGVGLLLVAFVVISLCIELPEVRFLAVCSLLGGGIVALVLWLRDR